jgi:hypothetical protein
MQHLFKLVSFLSNCYLELFQFFKVLFRLVSFLHRIWIIGDTTSSRERYSFLSFHRRMLLQVSQDEGDVGSQKFMCYSTLMASVLNASPL